MKKIKNKYTWIILLVIFILIISTVYLNIIMQEKNKIENLFNTIKINELNNFNNLSLENNYSEINNKLINIINQINNLEKILNNEFKKIIYLRLILINSIFILIFIISIYLNKYIKSNKYIKKINKKIKEKNKLKKEINYAIKNKEFKLYIQPRYNTVTEEICAGEVLVRWIKETGEIIYPNKFINILEENNLIEKLDLYILEETCKKIEYWKNKKIKISLNQSKKNLINNKYINEIKKIINKFNFNKNILEIELTENIFIENKNKVKELEKELHKLNITIAIDDFGTGYSSYNLLSEINIDILKLDKKLFDNLENKKTQIIINTIIKMSKELNIKCVAEGIENIEQVKFLKQIKCEEIQGYYFSKPMPIEEFEKLILEK